MKRLLAALLLVPTLALGAANDLFVNQRDNTNTNTLTRTVTSPTADAILGYGFNGVVTANRVPMFWTLGAGLQLTGNVLSVPGAGAAPNWSAITGKPTTIAGYGITDAFNGSYAALTGVPLTFAPSAHTHAAADVTTGVFTLARLPTLPISQTTGLQTALDAKFPAPTGTVAQYLRGDGSLAAFPSIPAAQVQTDWNATTGLGVLLNKPTTLAGYGITDAATSGALASGLAGKFNTPSGTTAQYLRGDGSLATFPVLAPVATAGTYASLTGIPASFPPAAHTHAAGDIVSGTLAAARIPALAISQTSGLQTALDAKFATPTGTTAQYVRGDGSLATLPVAKRIETYTGTTNASGQITVAYSTAFATVPVVQPPAPAAANQVWTTVSSTTTGFTLQLNQRNVVTLLGLEVLLGATVPVVGTTATMLVVAQ